MKRSAEQLVEVHGEERAFARDQSKFAVIDDQRGAGEVLDDQLQTVLGLRQLKLGTAQRGDILHRAAEHVW